jgi:hypothetical protein
MPLNRKNKHVRKKEMEWNKDLHMELKLNFGPKIILESFLSRDFAHLTVEHQLIFQFQR